VYLFPEGADYTYRRPLGSAWHRIDSSVRSTDAPPELLAATGHRSIVNRGPHHTEYELADNELVDAVDGLLGTAHSAGG
jgi:hypothetical protein